jgi:outer membrane translocation and assembly module TamA
MIGTTDRVVRRKRSRVSAAEQALPISRARAGGRRVTSILERASTTASFLTNGGESVRGHPQASHF